jgi:2-hydroxychromene-2-carboxylate isomerase
VRSPGETLSRRVLPRAVVALSQVGWPSRLGASARRTLGRSGRVELFFAFDDPCSAVAALDLHERLARRTVTLVLRPVVKRGIVGDPAIEHKRRYAIEDARRLARRIGLELARSEPIEPRSCAFLAEWAAGAAQGSALRCFCMQSLLELWFTADGASLSPAGFEALWRAHFDGVPRAPDGSAAVRRNERRMRLHWMYETPAAWVHGGWYFAQDRSAQISERLDQLGWSAA